MSERASGGKKAARLVLLALGVLLGVAVVGGAIFYQEELTGWFRLQGWNTGPVATASQEFVAAAAAGDSDRVASFIAPDARYITPIRENGKITGFLFKLYTGDVKATLKKLAPTPKPEMTAPELGFMDGGAVTVWAAWPGDHALELRWDRVQDQWKLVGMSWRPQ